MIFVAGFTALRVHSLGATETCSVSSRPRESDGICVRSFEATRSSVSVVMALPRKSWGESSREDFNHCRRLEFKTRAGAELQLHEGPTSTGRNSSAGCS
jgi:hypothetical protein